MFFKKLGFTGLLLLQVTCLLAQVTLTGNIRDQETNETLIGVNVVLKGTTTGATTDLDGNFAIPYEGTFPVTLSISFIGYQTQDVEVASAEQKIKLKLSTDDLQLDVVDIVDSRLTEKQKESPTTVESMDIIAIKETPAANFYDGLGALKGVDLTAASLGFKVVNTRGFNSTRPVRSLQLIDGMDNQAPGLNFSVGNFAGASELDVQKVELIVGANSALYGPNAFNGVINITTKDPFLHQGFSVMGKVGERNLRETAIRYAHAFTNSDGKDKLGFKVNFSYMAANDWEATNYQPTDQSAFGTDNWGGYDAINIYGDEAPPNGANEFLGLLSQRNNPGLRAIYRTGYSEIDLVDYDTRNLKANAALHYKITNDVEAIYNYNYGTGTTVYQGDNRYSLKGLQIHQHKVEIRKPGKFFIRAYHTAEDAGDSYDAVFTALLLQDASKSDADWTREYVSYWTRNLSGRVQALPGFPDPNDPQFTQDWFGDTRDSTQNSAFAVMQMFNDSLVRWHKEAREAADGEGNLGFFEPYYEPGTERFQEKFDEITSKKTFGEGGSGFFDRSKLSHIQGEYIMEPGFATFLLGGNYRQYNPNSEGTIFIDTGNTVIVNREFGAYASVEKRVLDSNLILTMTSRLDKNENFDFLVSPAASAVYKLDEKHTFRLSFSSAIRNPTLQDQYLFYNVGRAILIGNLNGVDSLVTLPSLFSAFDGEAFSSDSLEYFNVDPVRPERVRTIEIGYKGTLFNNLFVDASYYYSWYTDFLGFKIGADVDIDPSINQITNTQVLRVSANSPDQVTTQGFSVGLNYYFEKFYAINGNYSWNRLDRQGSTDPIIPAFNTPEHKFNIGVSGRDIKTKIGSLDIRNYGFNINYKWVQGFQFEGSPQFTGFIPSYDMVDVQVNKRIPQLQLTFKLGASNVLNNEAFQAYGGPTIGRMGYFSVLFELDRL